MNKTIKKMNKTYNQKENIYIYLFFLIVFAALYLVGVWIVNYHLYVLFPAFVIFLIKAIKLKKEPEEAVLKLTDTEIHFLKTGKSFKYSDIERIHLNSKWKNGFLILKSSKKKEYISAAISKEDQKEIRDFVTKKINPKTASL